MTDTATTAEPHTCEKGWTRTGKGDVYPCRVCRPEDFARWAGGHFAADHDRAACVECRTGPPKARKRRGAGREPTPPPLGDEHAPQLEDEVELDGYGHAIPGRRDLE